MKNVDRLAELLLKLKVVVYVRQPTQRPHNSNYRGPPNFSR
jgi:hypothetical protein